MTTYQTWQRNLSSNFLENCCQMKKWSVEKRKKNISSFPVDYEDIVATYILVIPLPNDKILDWSKLKIFADDNLEVVKNDDLCL